MPIDLLLNLALFVFFAACFIDVSSLKAAPNSDIMGAAMWPQVILGLLMFMLLVNIAAIVKANKTNPHRVTVVNGATVRSFFKSKRFTGAVLIAAASFLLEPLGFIVTSFLFICAYGRLLGRCGPVRLAVISLAVTLLLFFLFSRGLSVMLPRGYWFSL